MDNETFNLLRSVLTGFLGSPTALVSGNGDRFKSATRGKATVYHQSVASGNLAEVAFDVESMSRRLHMSPAAFTEFVAQLRASTGRPVETNPVHDWPRVGLSTPLHVALLRDALQQQLRLG